MPSLPRPPVPPRRRRRALLTAAALLALHSATPALASTDAQRAAAQRDIEKAVDAYKAGDVKAALERFRAADAHAADRAGVRYNIGRCLEELERPLEARDAYRSMLGVEGLSADMRSRAEAKIAEIESTGLARLTVTCDRPAQVRIGAQPARPCPVESRFVAPGQQAIVATADHGAEVRESVELKAGQARILRLDIPAPPAVEASGGRDYARVDDPGDDGYARMDDVTQVADGGSTTGPIVLSVVGGVAVVAGGLALWAGQSSFDEATSAHADYRDATDPDEAERLRGRTQTLLDDGALYANAGYGLLIGGGAALVGGLVWYVAVDGPAEPTVWLQPGPGGVAVNGRW